jgi:RNA recognition motif-containing protein
MQDSIKMIKFLHFILALLIRGLDALTTEETIIDLLNKQSNYTLIIKNCHIARDTFTNVSMGFAFVEMGSIQVSFSFSLSFSVEDNIFIKN